MKLLIAIPALDEEESIASVIERTLQASRRHRATHRRDGRRSHRRQRRLDRPCVERARQFGPAITLIVFEQNRGYGAAIMEAWRQSDAELVGFLDADGTCDPLCFVELCSAILDRGAHMALGSRVHAASRMPLVRRTGNAVFATMLTALGSTRVRDAASGMRVVRRDCLQALMPLPDGLHFTPAMSARAILSDDLHVVEVDFPSETRTGRSKLRPFPDAWRFLRVILTASILTGRRAPRFLPHSRSPRRCSDGPARLAILAVRHLRAWMIYHFVVIQLSTTVICC